MALGWRPQFLTTRASLGLLEHPYHTAASFTQNDWFEREKEGESTSAGEVTVPVGT